MMRQRYIAAIDQGTGSTRCMVFDAGGNTVSIAQKEHLQFYPEPGWVEHDASEIWVNVQTVVQEAMGSAGLAADEIAAVGITNQRETTLVWDKRTGLPVHNAIVWQDTRTDELIRRLGADDGDDFFRQRTGLPLATYFSGPKLMWLLENIPGLDQRAARGEVLFGTMDSWLIWNLTGAAEGGRHVTDVTNASRTLLMNLETLDWDEAILERMGIPRRLLPEIASSAEVYAEATGFLAGVPVAAALGDQHAALFGQTAFDEGDLKSTYGTGSFLLMNTGDKPVRSQHGLITTIAYRIGDEPVRYALEGSIAVSGSLVQWFRDRLGLIDSAGEIEALAGSVEDNGGCYFVPAFTGLYAPYWRSDARGVIAGLTGYVTKAHLARAVLEASAWQTREVVDAMAADTGIRMRELRVDGGMTANNLLMQLLSDILGIPVVRPVVTETTCLGAAYAAGLAVGFWPDSEALRKNWRQDAQWNPGGGGDREREYRFWKKAVQRTLGWVEAEDGAAASDPGDGATGMLKVGWP